ncbi:MAG: hypothetical protein LBT08_10120 [Synergistaceae bacterium]|jgi:hypothetical protein|nr:hypothetical protein [Synergistaceae bacterium]
MSKVKTNAAWQTIVIAALISVVIAFTYGGALAGDVDGVDIQHGGQLANLGTNLPDWVKDILYPQAGITMGKSFFPGNEDSQWSNKYNNGNWVTVVKKNLSAGDAPKYPDIITGAISGPKHGESAENTIKVSGNHVEIKSGAIEKAVMGGITLNGEAAGNYVTIGAGAEYIGSSQNSSAVYGGFVYGGIKKSDASENHVTIDGGTINFHVYGGFVRGKDEKTGTGGNDGDTARNTVTIKGGTLKGDTLGGRANGGNADNNIVTIDGGTFEWPRRINGGNSNFGGASYNTVTISRVEGTIHEIVGGAASDSGGDGKAQHNAVTLSVPVTSGNDEPVILAGGSSTHGTGGDITHNTVNLTNMAGNLEKVSLYGGQTYTDDRSKFDLVTGNALNVSPSSADGLTVKSAQNFQIVNFDLPAGITSIEPILKVKEGVTLGSGGNGATQANAGIGKINVSGGIKLAVSDKVILIDAEKGSLTAHGLDESIAVYGSDQSGNALTWKVELSKDVANTSNVSEYNRLVATLTDIRHSDDTGGGGSGGGGGGGGGGGSGGGDDYGPEFEAPDADSVATVYINGNTLIIVYNDARPPLRVDLTKTQVSLTYSEEKFLNAPQADSNNLVFAADGTLIHKDAAIIFRAVLVQPSMRALRAEDGDIVTLPGSFQAKNGKTIFSVDTSELPDGLYGISFESGPDSNPFYKGTLASRHNVTGNGSGQPDKPEQPDLPPTPPVDGGTSGGSSGGGCNTGFGALSVTTACALVLLRKKDD